MKKKSIAPRVIALVAGFALVVFLGFRAVSGFKPTREGESVMKGGNGGYTYVIRILRKLGYRVQIFYDIPDFEAGRLGPGDALVVLCDDVTEDWESIESWTREGGRLFLPAGVEGAGDWSGKETMETEGELAAATDFSEGAAGAIPFDGYAFPKDSVAMDAIASVDGRTVFARSPFVDGEIVLIADAAALTNDALLRGGEEYAVFLNAIFLPSRSGTIAFYRERNWGKSDTDPVKTLFSGPFLAVTAQLLLAFAVFAAGSALRFGDPQRLNPRARRSTAAHLDAVGAFYARGRSEAMADESNAEHFLAALRSRLSLSAQATIEVIATRAAKAAGVDAGKLMDLLVPGTRLARGDAARRSSERYGILEKMDADRRTR